MIDSYEVGQAILPEDFADEFYCPSAIYEGAVVKEIGDDAVTLEFVPLDETKFTDTVVVSRSEMEEMLGWEAGSYE